MGDRRSRQRRSFGETVEVRRSVIGPSRSFRDGRGSTVGRRLDHTHTVVPPERGAWLFGLGSVESGAVARRRALFGHALFFRSPSTRRTHQSSRSPCPLPSTARALRDTNRNRRLAPRALRDRATAVPRAPPWPRARRTARRATHRASRDNAPGRTAARARDAPPRPHAARRRQGLKKAWRNLQGSETAPWQGAVCGSVSGAVSSAVTTPLDVVKTRMMLGSKDAAGESVLACSCDWLCGVLVVPLVFVCVCVCFFCSKDRGWR